MVDRGWDRYSKVWSFGAPDRARAGTFGERYERGYEWRGSSEPDEYARPDTRIHDDVCCLLTGDIHVDATKIDVKVDRGEVTLSGTVETRAQKQRAEDLAVDVPGVRAVLNHVRVVPHVEER
jgi:osmotically-inducible protein OsmY